MKCTRSESRTRKFLIVPIVTGMLWMSLFPAPWFGGKMLLPAPVEASASSGSPRTEGVVYAVTDGNRLISFNPTAPGTILGDLPITDIQEGDEIVAIDFRPRTGQLWGISQNYRIYTINPVTGAALGAAPTPLPPLAGSFYGADFDPVSDRLRLVSDADINVAISPDPIGITTDNPLIYDAGDANAGKNPVIAGAAYTSNFSGAGATTLYGIDAGLDTLVRIGSSDGVPLSAASGSMTTIGPLGVAATELAGFDIVSPSGIALAAMLPEGSAASSLYTVNLQTGAATLVGRIGNVLRVRDIAVGLRIETIYALTATNRLLCFSSGAPDQITRQLNITGLAAGEKLLGLDFRPLSGQLYSLSDQNRLYTINYVTGVASPVGAATFSPPLNGGSFGFDFNPVSDRLRVVSEARQNLRVNPNNGLVISADPDLSFAAGDPNAGKSPRVAGIAFDNNLPGATETTLYGIDSNLDALVLHGSKGGMMGTPDSGQLSTIGDLGVNTLDEVGFDIAADTRAAFASLTLPAATTSNLYTVNLITGAATSIGEIGGGEKIRGIALIRRVIATVSAASFPIGPVAPESLAAIFGNFQTEGGNVFTAPALPLPTTLGGVSVKVRGLDAGLLLASPGQINLLLPFTANDGPAMVEIKNQDGTIRSGAIDFVRSAPGIFTYFATGQGTAAALWTNDGVIFRPVFNGDGSPRPINPGSIITPTYLILYTTGVRYAPAANPNDANGVAEGVIVTINGVQSLITYAGPTAGFAGLDQINVIIPPELADAGSVGVQVTVDNISSNVTIINIGRIGI